MKKRVLFLSIIILFLNILSIASYASNTCLQNTSQVTVSIADSEHTDDKEKNDATNQNDVETNEDNEDNNEELDEENDSKDQTETENTSANNESMEHNDNVDENSNETEAIEPIVVKDYRTLKLQLGIKPNIAYLTFDDGPSWITEKVLDILKKENIKATFFICGNETNYGISLIKRMTNEGHAIGNHTYTHDFSYIYKNVSNFFKDLNRNEESIYNITGIRPKIVRLPGGSNNKSSLKYGEKGLMDKINRLLLKREYVYFDWNVSSCDASPIPPSSEEIIYNVLYWSTRQNSPIILMHDSYTKSNTLKALPTIIKQLKGFGYKFDIITTDTYSVAFSKVKILPIKNKLLPHILLE